jgi:hypothetical protein
MRPVPAPTQRKFIEQRFATRFRFTPIGIRGAFCHGIEMASAVRRTPRFALARSFVSAAFKRFAATNGNATIVFPS